MTDEINTLNSRFGLPQALQFTQGQGGLPVADIDTPLARARIALQGAQVLAWQPAEQHQVLWLSKAALFEPGKAVRGGVPVCWPWFGPRDGLPGHGFVRTRLWQVRGTALDADGQVVLRLGIVDEAATRALWDFAFDLELVVTVGTRLKVALTSRNTGSQPITLSGALHTYFAVADIAQTQVQGLAGCNYLDKVNGLARTRQAGAVTFAGETDRIYTGTRAECLIDDAAGQRVIHVAKSGSTSTVVWNPWVEREKTFADMAAGEYRKMLCVETCNAGSDEITLQPGAAHALTAIISVATN
jgi:glucose-6-phosphate 1-epimerase